MGKKNTTVSLTGSDGTKIKMTLSYLYLLRLRSSNPKAYKDYNRVMSSKSEINDEIERLHVLHAAYLCGCIQSGSEDVVEEFEDFLAMLPEDRQEVNLALARLISPKAAKDIVTPSE